MLDSWLNICVDYLFHEAVRNTRMACIVIFENMNLAFVLLFMFVHEM